MADVTQVLARIESGDPTAAGELLPLIYNELRKLARVRLRQEKPGHTLQATALVHEAYLRLVGSKEQKWDSRRHFFAAATEAIRRILIEDARRKARIKHGGKLRRVDLDDVATFVDGPRNELIALDEALARFAELEPEKAELVKLRFFGGFSIDEVADLLRISRTTAKRHWVYARACLLAELADHDHVEES
jgi:RNA polymerase sigma factor (TIGR02999 family)